MEAAAIEIHDVLDVAVDKLDELIVQAQPESAPLLFPLDQAEIVQELEFVYDEETRIVLYHKLKWPTLDALNQRQRLISTKNEFLGAGRFKTQTSDGVAANAWLWDRFRSQVKGYEWNGVAPDQWVDVADELAAEIPSEHKSEAIAGLLTAEFEVERPKGKGYVLGAQTYRVKQTYGSYVIWHVFNRPSDRDRRDISNKSRETQSQPGATRAKSESFTNLKPYTDLYAKLFVRLEGVTGVDPNISTRKDLVSGIWQLGAIDALMEAFEAPRRDLSTN